MSAWYGETFDTWCGIGLQDIGAGWYGVGGILLQPTMRALPHPNTTPQYKVYWSMATIPLLPLVATPLPNIPVYYAGYRVYSHYRALEGAKQLQTAFAQQDAQQLGALRDSLMVMQEVQGMQFPADSWPAHLLRTEKRYLDILEDWRSRAREFYGGPSPDALVPTFTASKELDRLVDPMVRLEHPLSDEAVSHITKQFDAPQLLELVARARRRVTGSSFPRDDF